MTIAGVCLQATFQKPGAKCHPRGKDLSALMLIPEAICSSQEGFLARGRMRLRMRVPLLNCASSSSQFYGVSTWRPSVKSSEQRRADNAGKFVTAIGPGFRYPVRGRGRRGNGDGSVSSVSSTLFPHLSMDSPVAFSSEQIVTPEGSWHGSNIIARLWNQITSKRWNSRG